MQGLFLESLKHTSTEFLNVNLFMFYQVKENEKNAMTMINAIRQSLMQCETASKSPVSSPGTPPVYPVQSPVNISPLYTLIV